MCLGYLRRKSEIKLNSCNLIRAFKRAVNKTGTIDFTRYGQRRTFATRLVYEMIRYF